MGSVAPQLGSAILGQLSGTGQGAQSDVAGGMNPRSDAGTALAGAGASLAQAAQGLFSQGGVLNTTVGLIRTDSVGMAHTMQVGTSQAVNVGQTQTVNVGKAALLTVGEQYVIQVGQSSITMNSDGTILIKGINIFIDADTHIQHSAEVIDLN